MSSRKYCSLLFHLIQYNLVHFPFLLNGAYYSNQTLLLQFCVPFSCNCKLEVIASSDYYLISEQDLLPTSLLIPSHRQIPSWLHSLRSLVFFLVSAYSHCPLALFCHLTLCVEFQNTLFISSFTSSNFSCSELHKMIRSMCNILPRHR